MCLCVLHMYITCMAGIDEYDFMLEPFALPVTNSIIFCGFAIQRPLHTALKVIHDLLVTNQQAFCGVNAIQVFACDMHIKRLTFLDLST